MNMTNWKVFENKYIKFIEREEVELWLVNDRDETTDIKQKKDIPCLVFDVIRYKDDAYEVGGKLLSVTSKKLIKLLKPLVMEAAEDKKVLKVKIMQIGEGYDTNYTVKVVE